MTYHLYSGEEHTGIRIMDEGKSRHWWVLYDQTEQVTGALAVEEAKMIGDAVWKVRSCESRFNRLPRSGAPEGKRQRAANEVVWAGNALEDARKELEALCPTGPVQGALF